MKQQNTPNGLMYVTKHWFLKFIILRVAKTALCLTKKTVSKKIAMGNFRHTALKLTLAFYYDRYEVQYDIGSLVNLAMD